MTNSDVNFEKLVAGAFEHDDRAPDFDQTWRAAESRYTRGRRYRALSGLAATVTAVAILLKVLAPAPTQLPLIEMGELLGTTSWQAPSDVLLPERQIDIYQDLPDLIESTDGTGEALL